MVCMLCISRRPCVCFVWWIFKAHIRFLRFIFFTCCCHRFFCVRLLCRTTYVITSKAKGKFTEHSARFCYFLFVGRCFLFTFAHTSTFGNCPKKKTSKWNQIEACSHASHTTYLRTYDHARRFAMYRCSVFTDGSKCGLVANKNRFWRVGSKHTNNRQSEQLDLLFSFDW